jgi:hypothetical protein
MVVSNVTELCTAERAYWAYEKSRGSVGLLIEWFQAELEGHPTAAEKYRHYSPDALKAHTRHVEYLAREMRDARQLQQKLQVA